MIDLSPIRDARSREILQRRLNGEILHRIAADYGVTRERVRQVINVAVKQLHGDSFTAACEILDRVHISATSKKELAAQTRHFKQQLRASLLVEFNPARILGILGLENDSDARSMSELELCDYVYDQFFIGDCYKYVRCTICKSFKLRKDFSPAIANSPGHKYQTRVCRACNTTRTREHFQRNPQARLSGRLWQKTHPNRCRISQLRYYFKKTGHPELMPPVPPRGIPDSEILVPRNPGIGHNWWNSKTKTEQEAIKKKRLANWNRRAD